jgi:hypothetical protein
LRVVKAWAFAAFIRGLLAKASNVKQAIVIWPMVLRIFVFTLNNAESEGETYQQREGILKPP